MQALRHEILPPSGVEFVACLNLTPSTIPSSSSSQVTTRVLFNVVVARSNLLRVYEVREELAPISSQKDDERERRSTVRKGTEAVEGEVEMDASGEGYVNMGTVKVNSYTQYSVSSNSLLGAMRSTLKISIFPVRYRYLSPTEADAVIYSPVYQPGWRHATT